MHCYQLRSWAHAKEVTLDEGRRPGFAKHLRDLARPRQIAFARLMVQFQGSPIGIECKATTRDAWAFVLPDVSGESPFRIQTFDADGFIGHNCHNSLIAAVEAMISDGYTEIDAGALDRLAATPRWAMGQRRANIRLQFNLGHIIWAECVERMNALH